MKNIPPPPYSIIDEHNNIKKYVICNYSLRKEDITSKTRKIDQKPFVVESYCRVIGNNKKKFTPKKS